MVCPSSATLAQPEAGAGGSERGIAAEQLRFEPRRLLAQRCRDRIVERRHGGADHERNHERRRDELPGRDAGRPRHDELQAARQIQIAEHRRDEHGEGHDPLGDEGYPIERDLGDEECREILDVSGAAEHLDEIDHRDQRECPCEHGEDRGQEAQSEISRERAGHEVCPIGPPARCARRSAMVLIALVMKAGGSTMKPREMPRYPSTKAPTSATYGSASTIGV